ncbi:MAG: hypothetical protein WBG19_00230 [Thermoplasmata archaeon]
MADLNRKPKPNQKGIPKMEVQDCVVTVNVGTKEFSGTYAQIVRSSVTTDDVLKLMSNEKDARQLINDWHYGQDLRAKADTRAKILNGVSSTEVSFEKSVKEFMKLRAANGKPISEEKARQVIKAMQEAE